MDKMKSKKRILILLPLLVIAALAIVLGLLFVPRRHYLSSPVNKATTVELVQYRYPVVEDKYDRQVITEERQLLNDEEASRFKEIFGKTYSEVELGADKCGFGDFLISFSDENGMTAGFYLAADDCWIVLIADKAGKADLKGAYLQLSKDDYDYIMSKRQEYKMGFKYGNYY